MNCISLNGLEFFAYHGCFDEEKTIGTNFNIDLMLYGDFSIAEQTDNLNDTINYQDIYLLIKQEMNTSSNLLENVARRILKKISDTYPQIIQIEIKLSKMNPPLGGKLKSVTYSTTYNKA